MMGRPEVNIVHVVLNEHGPIFAEIIELLVDSMEQIGIGVQRSTNQLSPGRLNIIIGATVTLDKIDYKAIKQSGQPYVVFQVEALDAQQGFAQQHPAYVDFLGSARQIWDYSPTNLAFLEAYGCADVTHVPIGYSNRLERIQHRNHKDIDVLFYGAVNARRRYVLEQMHNAGINMKVLFGAYGAVRDDMIARSKIVLNLLQFDLSHLEEIRIAYLLNNRCFVVSETADRNPYKGGVVFCDYADIVKCCISFLQADTRLERTHIANIGYAVFKEFPTTASIQQALGRL